MKTILTLLLASLTLATAEPTQMEMDFYAEWARIADHYNRGNGTIEDYEAATLRLIQRYYPGNQEYLKELADNVARERRAKFINDAREAAERARRTEMAISRADAILRRLEQQRIEAAIRDGAHQIQQAIQAQTPR